MSGSNGNKLRLKGQRGINVVTTIGGIERHLLTKPQVKAEEQVEMHTASQRYPETPKRIELRRGKRPEMSPIVKGVGDFGKRIDKFAGQAPIFRSMKKKLILITLAALIFLYCVVPIIAQDGCNAESVCLKVISQRWLTKVELDQQSPLSMQSIAVRLRLSNDTRTEIRYLTGLDSIQPLGYRLYRKIGETEWLFLPKTNKRSEALLRQSGSSGTYLYLRLPPHSALEFEVMDWSTSNQSEPGEEHMFSMFIKTKKGNDQDTPIELDSSYFRPLKR